MMNNDRMKKQLRMVPVGTAETREATEGQEQEMHIVGRPIVFGKETVLFTIDGIDYKERIDPHALDEADMGDIVLKYNHSHESMPVSRTRKDLLKFKIDGEGVEMDAKLLDISVAKDLFKCVQAGILDKMSWAFTILEESYDKVNHLWTVRRVGKVFDFSVVDFPAYDDTSASARNQELLADRLAVAEAEKAEREADDEAKRKQAEEEELVKARSEFADSITKVLDNDK